MCEVHKPDRLPGIDIKITNLSLEDLQGLPAEGVFMETDHGNFILENVFYGDELVYLLIRLNRARKLDWTIEKKKDWRGWPKTNYVVKYQDLEIVIYINDSGDPTVLLRFKLDKNFYATSSRLISQLWEEVCDIVDPNNKPITIDRILDEEYERVKKQAVHRATELLRSIT
jgi:hypothetical protein